jgi:translation initiation factor IF-1
MRKRTIDAKNYLSLLVVFIAILAGCENIALMPRPSLDAPDPPTTITAMINGIDQQRQEIYLRTARNQHYVVNYTANTRVTDRDKKLAVNDLRTGDQVRVNVRDNPDRRIYADDIILESVGAPGASGIRTVEGTVERILPERGFLELRAISGELLTVYIPESSSPATREHFNRIRVGDVVRIEGERLSEDRLELLAFR